MGESGILGGDDRVELLDGEIIKMTPIGSEHAGTVSRLTRLLVDRVGDEAIVWPQNPIELGSYSEPEPDVALLTKEDDEYRDGLPTADDTLLVIEVADSSLRDDLESKVPLYARHAVPVVWVVNLVDQSVEVFEAPEEGEYTAHTVATGDAALDVESLPGFALTPSDIFE